MKDGLAGEDDIRFSSSATTITASWGNFSDPESGIAATDVYFYTQQYGQFGEVFFSEYAITEHSVCRYVFLKKSLIYKLICCVSFFLICLS